MKRKQREGRKKSYGYPLLDDTYHVIFFSSSFYHTWAFFFLLSFPLHRLHIVSFLS